MLDLDNNDNSSSEYRMKIEKINEYKQLEEKYNTSFLYDTFGAAMFFFISIFNFLIIMADDNERIFRSITLTLFSLLTIIYSLKMKKRIKERDLMHEKIDLLENEINNTNKLLNKSI